MLYYRKDNSLFELITSGSMFAGKTSTLLTRLETFIRAGRKVQLFYPKGSQDRYKATGKVVAHNGIQMPGIEVKDPEEILAKLYPHVEVIGIDEIQLFPASIVSVVEKLVADGHIVIGAGLTLLADGRSFGPMPELLARADVITQVYGVCTECGNPAVRCWPKFNKTEDVVLGNDYIALCRRCWYKKQEEEKYADKN
jgi:thymidine kinase